MSRFTISDYTVKGAIQDILRYGDVLVSSDWILKDHGAYVEAVVNAETREKGHVTFDLYFDEDGKLVRWEQHK